MLRKEDFIKLMEQKEHRYIEIEDPASICSFIDKALEQLYKKLKTVPYRDIKSSYSIRLFEAPNDNTPRVPHDISLDISSRDKNAEDIDRMGYWFTFALRRYYGIKAMESKDEFRKPNIWIPTDQFKESTSKLEEFIIRSE